MRIDKFLKTSRIIKRREVSKQLCLNDRVKINEKIVKPGYNVDIDDIIELKLGFKLVTIKVISLTYKKDLLMYQLISEEKIDNN